MLHETPEAVIASGVSVGRYQAGIRNDAGLRTVRTVIPVQARSVSQQPDGGSSILILILFFVLP